MRRAKAFAVLSIVALLLAACATQPVQSVPDAPGFWRGLVHGIIAPFALIASPFTDVRIYAVPNSGWWYDLGFFIGIAGASGSGATYARR
jgi:hypothetical protein